MSNYRNTKTGPVPQNNRKRWIYKDGYFKDQKLSKIILFEFVTFDCLIPT